MSSLEQSDLQLSKPHDDDCTMFGGKEPVKLSMASKNDTQHYINIRRLPPSKTQYGDHRLYRLLGVAWQEQKFDDEKYLHHSCKTSAISIRE